MLVDYIDRRSANVYGIYGHLGGGKSLTAVELSLNFLRLGWSVTSNILIRSKSPKYHFIEDFQDVDFWSLPCGAPRGSDDPYRSVIVVDECAEFFDQYSSNSPYLKSFLSWLRHSSKRGQFVFLIVQKPEFISKSLRLLINKWIVCDDMEQFRLPYFKCRIPFTKGYVARRIFDRYGNLLSRGFNFASKSDIGRFYDTSQSIALQGRQNDFISSLPPAKAPSLLPFYLIAFLYVLFIFYNL